MKIRFLFMYTFLLYSAQLFSAVQDEKLFVVVTASYNNSQWYEKNLSSVFSQNYQKFLRDLR